MPRGFLSPQHPHGRVLVTGAPGWLGDALVRRLRTHHREVRCLVYPEDWSIEAIRARPEMAGVELFDGDIRDPEAPRRAMSGVSTVFHLASVRHPSRVRDFREVNVDGTANCARAAAEAQVECFVHISSISVHGHNRSALEPFDESSPATPTTPYGRTKWQSESVIREFTAKQGLRSVILRPGPFYGPGQGPSMDRLMSLVERAQAPAVGASDHLRSFAHLENVVDAVLAAERSTQRSASAFFIADARPYSVHELLATIADALSIPLRLWSIPTYASRVAEAVARLTPRLTGINAALFAMAGEMGRHSFCSVARAEALLGYRPVRELNDGIRAAAAEYRAKRLR